MILLGIEIDDNTEDVKWLANKTSQLRIFSDIEGKMNNSITDVDGAVIVVSQFTLHRQNQRKGNSPSYIKACQARTSNSFI